MYVISTRDAKNMIPATMAVLKGIAGDGGLYVPEYFPKLDMAEVIETANSSYSELSALILSTFFEMGRDDLNALTKAAYASFDAPETVPVKRLSGSEYVLELFHGPTLAFKDMALQVLPRLISEALEIHEQGNGVLILTATSGDTGKAALEGFKDVPRTAILVFYPASGVSPMQKLQMVTQEGSNTGVCAVEGNFDDAQTGVKQLFANAGFVAEAGRKNYELSSANSINIGRLAPQVAYYAYAYAKLVNDDVIDEGDSVNFCVPTGNFGNILAAYYACRMGVPVNKLICASNRNNILTDFFHSGNYDTNREFHKTMSPSMDILISSNLERLLFEICGRDSEAVKRLMDALAGKGAYSLPEDARRELSGLFYAGF